MNDATHPGLFDVAGRPSATSSTPRHASPTHHPAPTRSVANLATRRLEFRVFTDRSADAADSPVRRLVLPGTRYTFGSAEGCSIRIPDSRVRPIHAVMHHEPDGLALRCYAEPVEINGRSVIEAALRVGDMLRIGNLRFELLEAVYPTIPTPTPIDPADEADNRRWRLRLKEEIDRWQKRQREMDQRRQELDARENDLRRRQSDCEMLRRDLKAREKVQQNRLDEAARQLIQSRQRAEAAAASAQTIRRQFEDLNRHVDDLTDQQRQIEQRNDTSRIEHEKIRRDLARERDEAIEHRSRLEAERKTAIQKQAHAEELRGRAELERDDAVARVAAAEEAMREAVRRAEESSHARDAIESANQKLEEVTEQLESLRRQSMADIADRNQLIDRQREEISQLQSETESLKESVRQAQEESRDLQRLCDEAREKVADFESMLASREQQYESESGELRERVDALSNQLASANAELCDVQNVNDRLQSELADLRRDTDDDAAAQAVIDGETSPADEAQPVLWASPATASESTASESTASESTTNDAMGGGGEAEDVMSSDAVSSDAVSSDAVSSDAVSSDAVSSEGVSSEGVSGEVDPNTAQRDLTGSASQAADKPSSAETMRGSADFGFADAPVDAEHDGETLRSSTEVDATTAWSAPASDGDAQWQSLGDAPEDTSIGGDDETRAPVFSETPADAIDQPVTEEQAAAPENVSAEASEVEADDDDNPWPTYQMDADAETADEPVAESSDEFFQEPAAFNQEPAAFNEEIEFDATAESPVEIDVEIDATSLDDDAPSDPWQTVHHFEASDLERNSDVEGSASASEHFDAPENSEALGSGASGQTAPENHDWNAHSKNEEPSSMTAAWAPAIEPDTAIDSDTATGGDPANENFATDSDPWRTSESDDAAASEIANVSPEIESVSDTGFEIVADDASQAAAEVSDPQWIEDVDREPNAFTSATAEWPDAATDAAPPDAHLPEAAAPDPAEADEDFQRHGEGSLASMLIRDLESRDEDEASEMDEPTRAWDGSEMAAVHEGGWAASDAEADVDPESTEMSSPWTQQWDGSPQADATPEPSKWDEETDGDIETSGTDGDIEASGTDGADEFPYAATEQLSASAFDEAGSPELPAESFEHTQPIGEDTSDAIDNPTAAEDIEEVAAASAAGGSEPEIDPDDDSIEAYMNRLLGRVQGHSSQPTTAESVSMSAVTKSQPAAESVATDPNETPDAATEDEPLEPVAMVPRSQAPERDRDLSAMRELANDSARSALSTSSKKQIRQIQTNALVNFAVAGVCLVIGMSASLIVEAPLLYVAFLMALVAAGISVKQGLGLWAEARSRKAAAAS